MSIVKQVQVYYANYPLRTIILVALSIRILAAFFSKGYAFHDDHFCVVRVAQNWASGFPHWIEQDDPPKHSMLYAGINAGILWAAEQIGVSDQLTKTTILRLFHALYSLLIVLYGYKIVNFIAGRKEAALAGWILALLWFMPFMSVKFMAEMVCIPPVLIGFYLLIRANKIHDGKLLPYLYAGLLFGLAFTFRLHTILFAGGLGLVLLFRKEWLGSLVFTVGFFIMASVVIGTIDFLFYDYPFQSLVVYFVHNSENAYGYIQGSPLKFTGTTLGFLVPPISLLLIFGYLRSFRTEPMMFLAAAIFFVFHSAFPNQQERFILPVLPLFILLGVVGWTQFKEHSQFWSKRPGLLRGFWRFFWIVNVIAGLAMAFTYSKKDRIEPLYYLSKVQDVKAVIVENQSRVRYVPAYYLGSYCSDYDQFQSDLLGLKQFKQEKKYLDPKYKMIFTLGAEKSVQDLLTEMQSVNKLANYIVFKGAERFEERMERVKAIYPNREFELVKTIQPSNLDKLLHTLNPKHHQDPVAKIYKIISKPSVYN